MNLELERCPMGMNSSLALCQQIARMILAEVLKDLTHYIYADNFAFTHPDPDRLITYYEEFLKRCIEENLVLKLSELQLLYNMRLDGPFEALGYTVEGGKLKVPRKKVAEFRVCELPKNRKGVETLIGKLNFFNIFSPCFGTAMAELRKEMKLQSTGKFNLSNRMKDLLNYLLSILTNSNGLHLLDEKQISVWKHINSTHRG